MIQKGIQWSFLLTILWCCGTKTQQSTNDLRTKVKDIVLINAETIDRCQMGELITSLSKCNPKVIGINFLFVGVKDKKCDSTLRQSITESEKVVLVEGYENGTHIESDKLFSHPAMLTGLTGLAQNENGVTDSYYRLTERAEYSLPMHVALQYDTNRQSEIAAKSFYKDYPINFYHQLPEFEILNYKEVSLTNCDLLTGKIILIGYLGPGDENLFKTPVTNNSSDKTYGTVIIGNIVLDILKDIE